MSRFLTVVIPSVFVLLLLAGCPPKYPKCDNDEQCKEGEFCVNGMCQQCRDDRDCGSGQLCKGGRCEAGCRGDEDCPGGQVCRDEKCVPCESDADCGEECEHQVIDAPFDPAETVEDAARISGEPLGDPATLPLLRVAQAARREVAHAGEHLVGVVGHVAHPQLDGYLVEALGARDGEAEQVR